MQRVELSAFGLSNLRFNEVPVPAPAAGEVLLKVMACSINYRLNHRWGEACFELTGGADVVVETGGAGTLNQSMAALGYSGRIAYIGALAGFAGETSLMPLVIKNASVHGITVGSKADHQRMTRFVGQHQIKPVIDRECSFAQSIDAIAAIGEGAHFGKIVVIF